MDARFKNADSPLRVEVVSSIIEALAKCPLRLNELFTVVAVRNQALRLNIRRAGVSPGRSPMFGSRPSRLHRAVQKGDRLT